MVTFVEQMSQLAGAGQWLPPLAAFELWKEKLVAFGRDPTSPNARMVVYRWLFGEKYPQFRRDGVTPHPKAGMYRRYPKLVQDRDFILVRMHGGEDKRPKHYILVDPKAIDRIRIGLTTRDPTQARLTTAAMAAINAAAEKVLDTPEGSAEQLREGAEIDAILDKGLSVEQVGLDAEDTAAPMASEAAPIRAAEANLENAANDGGLFLIRFANGGARKKNMAYTLTRPQRALTKKDFAEVFGTPVALHELVKYISESVKDPIDEYTFTLDEVAAFRLWLEEKKNKATLSVPEQAKYVPDETAGEVPPVSSELPEGIE